MKIYEEKKALQVEKNVEIEVRKHFTQKENPVIVMAYGLFGKAGRSSLVDDFSREYNVITFSPRGAGESQGKLTIDTYLSDVEKVFDTISQETGSIPYAAIGHSMGGYGLARLLGKKPAAERAVLLCPLISMSEELSQWLKMYILKALSNNRSLISRLSEKIPFFKIGGQRFQRGDLKPFIQSVLNAPHCEKKLLCPTQVILTEGSSFGCSSNSKERKEKWHDLGAEVSYYDGVNHWISGNKYSLNQDWYRIGKETGIDAKIKAFLSA